MRYFSHKGSIWIKVLVIQWLTLVCVSRDFDFFYFVQQWPASYCDTKKSCCYPTTGKPAEDFGIHGLWPNYIDGSYPENCDSRSPFDASQISDLKSRLQEDWPTLACPSADGYKFWGHEWDKHGTCAESILDQHSYFEEALDLKNKANTLQALKTAGSLANLKKRTKYESSSLVSMATVRSVVITMQSMATGRTVAIDTKNDGIKPADGIYYTLGNIKEAIKESTGYTPYIECNVDTLGNHQLYEVYMCVEKTASEFIECPVFPKGRPCGSGIEFPSFSGTSAL